MSQTPGISEVQTTHTTDLETAKITPRPPSMAVQSYGMSDPGRVRSSNEDQFLVAELTKALRVLQTSLPQPKVHFSSDHGYLFLVADGMGGHAGGEQASALAVDTIEGFMLNTLKWFFYLKGSEGNEALAEFQTALAQADDRIFREASQHSELQGMGTTLTMAYSLDSDLFVVHVGDSRGYLFRDRTLYRLTRDHTVVGEMLRMGVLQPEQAAQHQLRHVVTNVVGGTKPGVQVEVHKVQLQPKDLLLLCTDGLTEMVSDQEIADLLQSASQLPAACKALIDRANHQGGKDNITVVLARFEAKE
jgi:serine/threonine protein phosphatase PrpC